MSRPPFSPRLGPAKRTIFVVVCIVFYFLVLCLVFHLSVCALVGRRQRKRTTAAIGVWLAVAGGTVISTVGRSRISRFTWAEHEFTPEFTPEIARTDYVLGKWRTLCPTTNYWRTRH